MNFSNDHYVILLLRKTELFALEIEFKISLLLCSIGIGFMVILTHVRTQSLDHLYTGRCTHPHTPSVIPTAAITNCHRLGSVKNIIYYLIVVVVISSKIRVLVPS